MSEKAEPKTTKVDVVWTEKGEAEGAHSEHGQHKAGDDVKTEYAKVLIERGFAKAKK